MPCALNELDNSKCVYGDLTKDFDSVNHKLLLKKLHLYDICGPAFSWCQSYLRNRTQVVKLKSNENGVETAHVSYPGVCLSGVPQGSVLGPLVFILYIYNLIYADDVYFIHSYFNYLVY